ncbi:MAG: cell division topological specificity factor MinE [Firmicutes bacterium]|nr:cell division topological specificity factor MinE [Bacillota bacterium]
MLSMTASPGASAPSKDVARERLKIVLVQDRAEANRGLVEKLREELLGVVAKYAEIEAERAEVRIARVEGGTALLARVPVRSLKRVS